MKKIIVVSGLCFILSACGGTGYLVKNYGAFSDAKISLIDNIDGNQYRIFDRKDWNKLVVAPTLDVGIGHAVVRGASMYSVDLDSNMLRFKKAAETYLTKERFSEICIVNNGVEIASPQWEFVYQCSIKIK